MYEFIQNYYLFDLKFGAINDTSKFKLSDFPLTNKNVV